MSDLFTLPHRRTQTNGTAFKQNVSKTALTEPVCTFFLFYFKQLPQPSISSDDTTYCYIVRQMILMNAKKLQCYIVVFFFGV